MTAIQELYNLYLQNPSIETDTRKLKPGDIYFALKGNNFNGNQFALQALEKGASYAIVDEDVTTQNDKIIRVKDALHTLQQLAGYHRNQFSIPFIAITGSNGKTTTKELIHAVLSSHYRTYTTEGNLNNHIGIPLTLLKIKPDAQLAVIEMGANHLHEIAGYCVYTNPTIGIITNCGKAHLEGFGSMEAIQKGKGELYDYIRAVNGAALAFDDYEYLHRMSRGIHPIYWYGTQHGSVTGVAANNSFVEVKFTSGFSLSPLRTQLVGSYNLPNVLCAVAAGKYFDVPEEKIKSAIEQYAPSNSRSQLIEKNGNKIILDAYNANPSSMKAAIDNFAGIDVANKLLLLGSMAELGADSTFEHQQIVSLLQGYGFANVVLVGNEFGKINHPYLQLADAKEVKEWFTAQSFRNFYILIKGSRSMQMELIIS